MKGAWSSIIRNIGSLLLALALAVTVWVNAVTLENPDEERVLSFPLSVTVDGLQEGLVAQGYETVEVQVTVRAPRSVLDQLRPEDVRVLADLQGKTIGEYAIPLSVVLDLGPARVQKVEPSSLAITVDRLVTRTMSVYIELNGNPAAGFQTGTPALVPENVILSGPAAAVDRVAKVVAPMNVEGLRNAVDQNIPLLPLDTEGAMVPGVAINPVSISVALPVQQLGGYRDLLVWVDLIGSPKSGYRMTGWTVLPQVVTLYSDDPAVIRSLPGYVKTQPLDITGAQEDFTRSLSLVLPAGVQVVGDPKIQVQVSISAIEDTSTFPARPVRVQGLEKNLSVSLSPATVDVILSGPVPDLRALRLSDIDVFLDLAGLGAGTYKLTPTVRIPNTNLRVAIISPQQIEVVITPGPTPTP